MSTEPRVTLTTATDTVEFGAKSGRLLSFRSRSAPDQEFIEAGAVAPAFVVQYLDDGRRYRQLTSSQAENVEVSVREEGGKVTLTACYRRLGGLDLDVTTTVWAAPDARFSYWSIALANDADLLITDVQFPFVVLRYRLAGSPGSEALLWPYWAGSLVKSPRPQDLLPDCPHTWQMRPENAPWSHYPGEITAQFMAYYNDRAGIYIACQDDSGRIKRIRPVHHQPGLRPGITHVGDWPRR
ncbi:MAG: hypothetical protein HYY04_14710, partial [Chloroflexi bacterium]|nr:hypothetical protein [Chloroflexota bacterium]